MRTDIAKNRVNSRNKDEHMDWNEDRKGKTGMGSRAGVIMQDGDWK
jgi:hypothetical protein